MKITRDKGQEAAVNAFLHFRFLLVEYCTGFGKGKAALDAVTGLMKKGNIGFNAKTGMIITHSTDGRDKMWPEQVKQWAPDLNNYDIKCYQSLKKIKGNVYAWVIVDEAHYLTEHYEDFFKYNTCLSIFLMTATLPDDPAKIKILKKLSNKNILTITLDEAIANSVLNDYVINVWTVELTFSEWSGYLELCRKVDNADLNGDGFLSQMHRGERARYIYNLETKLKAACYLRDKLRAANRRFLIFTMAVDIADRLSEYCLYRGRKATDYNKFLNGEVNELASIKMIQEGANINGLNAALMHQINSKQLNFAQKLGRLMRMKIGEVAKIHVVIAKNTYDETWMRKASQDLDGKKITWHELERNKFEHYP